MTVHVVVVVTLGSGFLNRPIYVLGAAVDPGMVELGKAPVINKGINSM